MSLVLDVPGNLLIAGEYAVLEPGGLGLAVAVERRVSLTRENAPTLTLSGTLGAGTVRWVAGADRDGLLDAVVNEVGRHVPLPAVSISVDSSPFFSSRKLGYGSSAAVAVAVAAALLAASSGRRPQTHVVFERALAAHRAYQGGSGYDVAASTHGGTALFHGGAEPVWEPLRIPWLRGARLFEGAGPVSTPGATAAYRAWKSDNPARAHIFVEQSNALVRDLAAARTRVAACDALVRLRDHGIELGERIGVPAAIRPAAPPALDAWVWKALGAGNEIGLLLPLRPRAAPPSGSVALVPATRGLRWRR
jgi:phosphomevalonate kinase